MKRVGPFTLMIIIVCVIALLYGLTVPSAQAQTFAVATVGTDYVSRGTSQTYGSPSATLYVDHQEKSGLYIAGFTGYVDFDDDRTFRDGSYLEADAFGGYRFTKGKTNYEVGIAAINYLGAHPSYFNPSGNWNMVEVHVAATHPIGKTIVGGFVGLTPDYFNNFGKAVWVEGNAVFPIVPKLTGKVAIGRQQFFEHSSIGLRPGLSDYTTWNAGVGYALSPTLTVDARYHDTDTNFDLGPVYRPRFVLSVSKVF